MRRRVPFHVLVLAALAAWGSIAFAQLPWQTPSWTPAAGGATVSFRWVNNTTNAALTGTTFTAGTSNAVGSNGTIGANDLVLVEIGIQTGGSDPGAIAVAGYTSLVQLWTGANFFRTAVFEAIPGSASTPAVTWANSGSVPATNACWIMIDYTPTSGTPSIDTSGINANTSSTNMTANSISPSGSADMLIGFWGQYGNQGGYAGPATMTQRASTSSFSGAECLVAEKQLAASGATGNFVATQGGASPSHGALVAITP